jgi:pilus assembly protein Flp/PilA
MSKLVLRFLTNESGTTAIEYAIMAGSIAVVVIGTVNSVGSQISATFYTKISAAFK